PPGVSAATTGLYDRDVPLQISLGLVVVTVLTVAVPVALGWSVLVVLLVAGVVVVPVAIVWFAQGSSASSPGPLKSHRLRPPSVVQLRAFLRANGQHPTTCAAGGTRTVCVLASGAGRCVQDTDGNGECM